MINEEAPKFRPLESVEIMNSKLTAMEKLSFLYMTVELEADGE